MYTKHNGTIKKRNYRFYKWKKVKAKPEEIEAVQPFSKILVEEYNYPKDNITTHPQFRVSIRPSDTHSSYPVDIAIFNNKQKKIMMFIL